MRSYCNGELRKVTPVSRKQKVLLEDGSHVNVNSREQEVSSFSFRVSFRVLLRYAFNAC